MGTGQRCNPRVEGKSYEGLGHASKSMLICATLRFEGLPRNTETDVAVLKKLLELLTTDSTDILQTLVGKQLQGESLWSPDGTTPVETTC